MAVTGQEEVPAKEPEAAPDAPDGAPPPRVVDRKLLDDIFGDVLPDTTSDERDAGSVGGSYSEQWYRENRPPHHG